jgi:hypothetical protein
MMGAEEIVRIVLPTTRTFEAGVSLADVLSKIPTFSNRVAPGLIGGAGRSEAG